MAYRITAKGDHIEVHVDEVGELLDRDFLVAFYTRVWSLPGDPPVEEFVDWDDTRLWWRRVAERAEGAQLISYRLTHRRTRQEKTLDIRRANA